MNIAELQQQLISAARRQPADDRVPYAFEKRIMALVAERQAVTGRLLLTRGLWRAAVSCVVLAVVCGAIAIFKPVTAESGSDLSQEFENTLLASVDQPDTTPVNNWKIIPTIVLTTVLIFGAGVFTGGMLVNRVKPEHARTPASKPHPAPAPPPHETVLPTNTTVNSPASNQIAAARQAKPPEIVSKEFVETLDTELRLTREEHAAIEKIVNDGQNEMRKVVQDARLEMREVLTPQQREQFDNLIKKPFHKPLFGTNAQPTNVVSAHPVPSTNAP